MPQDYDGNYEVIVVNDTSGSAGGVDDEFWRNEVLYTLINAGSWIESTTIAAMTIVESNTTGNNEIIGSNVIYA